MDRERENIGVGERKRVKGRARARWFVGSIFFLFFWLKASGEV